MRDRDSSSSVSPSGTRSAARASSATETPGPDLVEGHADAIHRRNAPGDEDVDPFVRLDGRIEGRDVVDVKPEVVVGGEDRYAQRDESAATDQQRAGAATMAGGGGPVSADDSPPGHIGVEQTHCAADLTGADSDPLTDVSVGRDATGRNGLDVFTDVIDDAHSVLIGRAGR